MQAVSERVYMKKRQRQKEPVRTCDLPASEQIDSVCRKVVVRENGALGRAGRAGRVDDSGGGVAIQGHGERLGFDVLTVEKNGHPQRRLTPEQTGPPTGAGRPMSKRSLAFCGC